MVALTALFGTTESLLFALRGFTICQAYNSLSSQITPLDTEKHPKNVNWKKEISGEAVGECIKWRRKKSKNTHLFVHMYVNALLQKLTARLNQTLDLD